MYYKCTLWARLNYQWKQTIQKSLIYEENNKTKHILQPFNDVGLSALLKGSASRKCPLPKPFIMPFSVSGETLKWLHKMRHVSMLMPYTHTHTHTLTHTGGRAWFFVNILIHQLTHKYSVRTVCTPTQSANLIIFSIHDEADLRFYISNIHSTIAADSIQPVSTLCNFHYT